MSDYNFGGIGRNLTKLYYGTWLEAWAIKWTLFLQGVPTTKFGRAKISKIRRDFWQLSTLIANISVTHRHVGNLNSTWSTTFHPLFGEKKLVNFGPLTKVIDAHVDPPNWTFSGDYISAHRGCWPLKFYACYSPLKCIYVFQVGRGAPGGLMLGSAPYF